MESVVLPFTCFTLFPELPSEMRLKIWRHIFPGPRIVGIQPSFTHSRFTGWKSMDWPPLVLQITHESREEALKYYRLSFATASEPATIYFNFRTDTLRFGHGLGEAFLNDPRWAADGPGDYVLNVFLGTNYHIHPRFQCAASDWDKLRYMIIDVDEGIYGRRTFCWGEIRQFDNLQELTLLPWDRESKAEELMEMFQTTLNTVAHDHPEWKVPKVTVLSALTRKEWGILKPEPIQGSEA